MFCDSYFNAGPSSSSDTHLDVVDAAGSEISTQTLVRTLVAEASSLRCALDTPDQFTVFRNNCFRYRTRRPRRTFAQFCGHVGSVVLAGARHVEGYADAVDLNFGCPQDIARRGNYGAFLLEQWSVMKDLVSTLYNHLSIPVTCKMRILPQGESATLALARMLQDHGAQVTVRSCFSTVFIFFYYYYSFAFMWVWPGTYRC